MLRPALASALALAFLSFALAHDTGEWTNISPQLKHWFKSLRNAKGFLCCDIADGHRASWRRTEDGSIEVLIEDQWMKVPPESILGETENPLGEAIVWHTAPATGDVEIRCFLAGSEI